MLSRRQLLAAPAALSLSACATTGLERQASDALVLDDQSRLNAVRVARRVRVGASDADIEAQFRAAIKAAREEGRPFVIGGARHSMGGQSLPPKGGVAADFTEAKIEVDRAARTYRVSTGARWREVIGRLDPLGLSPAVMQSNNDFSVGGSISVNAHGWAAPCGPVGSTVLSLRLMLASGEVVTCSPRENSNLFALAVGGYGLAGLILEAEMEAVENALLAPSVEAATTIDLAGRFVAAVNEPATRMAYGRLNVSRDRFLEEALLTVYRPAAGVARPPSPAKAESMTSVARGVFRAQTGSDAGKSARWFAETKILPGTQGPQMRNAILNTPVAFLGSPGRGRTDILHEYFLSPAALAPFLAACRRLIPASGMDLLNITLRYVAADRSSLMGYAPQERIAAVMFFSQRMTPLAETAMRALTEGLVQSAIDLGGSFYLPYRLHARHDQLVAAYAATDRFVAAKRRVDPDLVFRNLMWEHYFSKV